jgi:chemotaxis protein CheZ
MKVSSPVDQDLARQLEELKRAHGPSIPIDFVAEVVRSLLGSLRGDLSSADLHIYEELDELVKYIQAAKSEIASIRPDEIQSEYIPSATDELDAIVEATEAATNQILDAVEKIESLQSEVPPEIGEKIAEITTEVYEACNFQDITGQRITKVVKALKHIEEKVEALVSALGGEKGHAAPPPPPVKEESAAVLSDQDLLNGPQLPPQAQNQADIDALFASFD